MHRFFVPEENRTENEIVIHGDDVNHIRNVLRMTKGEKIMVSCGKGVDYECEILAVSDSEISLLIRETGGFGTSGENYLVSGTAEKR